MTRLLSIFLLSFGLVFALAPQSLAAEQAQQPVLKMYKAPGWGCCGGWGKHLEDAGFRVTSEDVRNISEIKARYRVPVKLQSCHTAIVDGYVLEGHVPKEEVFRLLEERPNVIGLSVPGMPIGSPGMEMPGREADPYEVLSFDHAGTIQVYATYPK